MSLYHLVTSQKGFCKKNKQKKSSFCLQDVMSDFILFTSGCITSASVPCCSQTTSQNTAALTNFFGASISITLTNWSHIEDDTSQMLELANLCYLCEKNTDKSHDLWSFFYCYALRSFVVCLTRPCLSFSMHYTSVDSHMPCIRYQVILMLFNEISSTFY